MNPANYTVIAQDLTLNPVQRLRRSQDFSTLGGSL